MKYLKENIIFLFIMINTIMCIECLENSIIQHFTGCKNNKRAVVFSWTNPNCTNSLPSPIKNLSCNFLCEAGTFLLYNLTSNNLACESCPSDTYNTGNALRISSEDLNWDELPKEARQSCYWIKGIVCFILLFVDDGLWTSQPCQSFVLQEDKSAIYTNKLILKPNTTNILELRISVYLVDKGTIKFTYKKASKIVNHTVNGAFKFEIDNLNILDDNKAAQTSTKSQSYAINEGLHQIGFYYTINTQIDHSDLYAEISVNL